MRLLTNLMIAGALIFGFILIEHHYHIADRLWQFRSSGSTPPNGPKNVPPRSPASPSTPGESAIPTDHDYQLVIDVSGKGPFMAVVHGPDSSEQKAPKKKKRTVADHREPTKVQPQAVPAPSAPQALTATQPQATLHPQSADQPSAAPAVRIAPQPQPVPQAGTKPQ